MYNETIMKRLGFLKKNSHETLLIKQLKLLKQPLFKQKIINI